MAVELFVLALIVLIIGIIGVGILFKIAGLLIKVLVHVILGWIFLFLVNLLPFINIPINVLTVLVAGFGGIIGVALLIIAQALGLF